MENPELLDLMFKNSKSAPKSNDQIICIVDRSGSMGAIRKDAEGGLNSFINEQKEVEGGANVTIVDFDDAYDVVCDAVDINDVEPYKLVPRGMTALLDAIGRTVNGFQYDGDGKVIVVVVTDGDENRSQEYTRDQIFDLITEKKEAGWEFMFLAANQDAISAGGSMGFDADATVSFAGNSRGVAAAYANTAVYTTSLRTKSKSAALADKADHTLSNADVLSDTGAVE